MASSEVEPTTVALPLAVALHQGEAMLLGVAVASLEVVQELDSSLVKETV